MNINGFIEKHNRNYIYGKIQSSIKIGDKLNLTIHKVGSKGDGIAKYKEFNVFVPDAKIGQKVEVEITNVSGNNIFSKKIGGKNEAIQN